MYQNCTLFEIKKKNLAQKVLIFFRQKDNYTVYLITKNDMPLHYFLLYFHSIIQKEAKCPKYENICLYTPKQVVPSLKHKNFYFLCKTSLNSMQLTVLISKLLPKGYPKQGEVSCFSAGTFPVAGNYMHRKQGKENYQKRLSQNR